MKGVIKLVKDFTIEETSKQQDYRIVIDYLDDSYSVYYIHIKDNRFIVDNSKVDPDYIYGDKCNACKVDKFLNSMDDVFTSFICLLLDR